MALLQIKCPVKSFLCAKNPKSPDNVGPKSLNPLVHVRVPSLSGTSIIAKESVEL